MKVDVSLSDSLELIQTQIQMSPQFYHPLLQCKGPTTLHDHGQHPYVLELVKELGFGGGFCCYRVFFK